MIAAERNLAKSLSNLQDEVVELHKHVNLDGIKRWKLKTKDGRPLNCINQSLLDKMEGRIGLITGQHSLKFLNVAQLKANLFDWETRKANAFQKLTDKDSNRRSKKTTFTEPDPF